MGSWCEATNTRARRTLRRLQGERMRGASSRKIQAGEEKKDWCH